MNINIIEPKVEFVTPINGEIILKRIEECGRTCYQSQGKISKDDTSARRFAANIIRRGHESVLEHCSFTVRFIVDRAIANEIIRHRIASFSQESTRYVNYSDEGPTFVKPNFFKTKEDEQLWRDTMASLAQTYKTMIEHGMTPQEARCVLPNSLKTELIMTANIREWRHFLKLRTAPAAHPQMRQVACQLLDMCKEKIPVLFDDINY